jgi:hypothetical protein
MRILMNLISPLTLFWCVIYTLAVSLIFIAEILVCARDSKRAPARNQSEPIRSNYGFGS